MAGHHRPERTIMNYDFQPVTVAFEASNAGVSLVSEKKCEHGHPAFGLTFPGRWVGQGGDQQPEAPVSVILARCTATHIAGSIAAFIAAAEGLEASVAFMDEARAAFNELGPAIRDLYNQGRLCCEAAFRTGGREHTCSQGGPRS
jgi:hypothetical protein